MAAPKIILMSLIAAVVLQPPTAMATAESGSGEKAELIELSRSRLQG